MGIRLGSDICSDFVAATSREWLETNGLGGFASSTVAGLNTRRYHALLTAATKPPVGRMVLLSKLEETLVLDGRRFELSANQYPDVVHPQGFRYLREFRIDPFPVFTYDVEGVLVEKCVYMVHGQNTTVVSYHVHGATASAFEVRPLIAFRDYHSTTHQNPALNPALEVHPGCVSMTPYETLPTLHLAHNADLVGTDGCWYRNFSYAAERERGLDDLEDLYNPLTFRFTGSHAAVIASIEMHSVEEVEPFKRREVARRGALHVDSCAASPLVEELVAAADHYVVQRAEKKTLIAGYHWFADWGRDTMIALPGLTLVTGRFDVAQQILSAYAGCVSEGMLPNRFPDAGEAPEYNTVDASLWFFEAVRSLVTYSGDYGFVRTHLYETLKDILSWHLRGTRYGIIADSDGLLRSGVAGAQLTWMDARIGDWVVTPRHGKPVEIQALWYNAFRIVEDLAQRFDDSATHVFAREFAEHVKQSFNNQFWNADEECLFDVVDAEFRDGAIRPNQIFAASLTHGMLSTERAQCLVEVVQRELLTPMGLRTLSPRDSRYRGTYEGGVFERDSAYHQGTVWPWLMGSFISAFVRVNDRSAAAVRQAASWLGRFESHLRESGLGHISEICDGESPHRPRGCVAQAWSLAEILRAAVEDVFASKPHTAAKVRT